MAVRKRGTSSWMADFMVAGVRYRETFGSLEAAEDWEADARKAIKRGKPVPAIERSGGEGTSSMDALLKLALRSIWSRCSNSDSTVARAKVFVEWAGGAKAPKVALSKASQAEFVEFLREERGVSCSTINQYLATLGTLTKVAGLPRIEGLIQRVQSSQRRFFTVAEVTAILDHLTSRQMHRERDFIAFLIDTGARPYSEATKLRWQDIHAGKAVAFAGTKGGAPRILPLTSRCRAIVEREPVGRGPFADITQAHMRGVWEGLRKAIPSLDDTVLYTCRHTCASWQVIRGVDIRRVQQWLGHRNIATTLIYANLAPAHLADNLRALDCDENLTRLAA